VQTTASNSIAGMRLLPVVMTTSMRAKGVTLPGAGRPQEETRRGDAGFDHQVTEPVNVEMSQACSGTDRKVGCFGVPSTVGHTMPQQKKSGDDKESSPQRRFLRPAPPGRSARARREHERIVT